MNEPPEAQAPRVLIADDHPLYCDALRAVVMQALAGAAIRVAESQEAVLAAVKGRDGFDLILLDLNLPRMDGREVLAHIKQDVSLKLIPTVILTTSNAEADIVKSYQLQANCYLTKPVQLEAFEVLVKSINDFWLTRAKLPQQKLSG